MVRVMCLLLGPRNPLRVKDCLGYDYCFCFDASVELLILLRPVTFSLGRGNVFFLSLVASGDNPEVEGIPTGKFRFIRSMSGKNFCLKVYGVDRTCRLGIKHHTRKEKRSFPRDLNHWSQCGNVQVLASADQQTDRGGRVPGRGRPRGISGIWAGNWNMDRELEYGPGTGMWGRELGSVPGKCKELRGETCSRYPGRNMLEWELTRKGSP